MDLTVLNNNELSLLFLQRHDIYMQVSKGFLIGTLKTAKHIEAKANLNVVIEEMNRRKNVNPDDKQ
jgi:hypothetical protein